MNWGKKLITGLVLFMIFIMGLATVMIMKSGDDALIENNYYEKGQTYDAQYAAKQNAMTDQVVPVITTDEYGTTIAFPLPVNYKLICKRLSDSRMDKVFEGMTRKDRGIKLTKNDLHPGPWLLTIEYTIDDKKYLFEGEIRMP